MRRLTAFPILLTLLTPASGVAANSPASESRLLAIHVLNRAAFGPAPGDVEKVAAIGAKRWIENQLQPDSIDRSRLDQRLARYSTLEMSPEKLWAKYYAPFIAARKARNSSSRDRNAAAPRRPRGAPRPQQVVAELTASKLERAVHSPAQLEEVLIDFWMNHFNVFAGKNVERVLVTDYERSVIRPNVLGKFEELVLATAKSPAMLLYLDNARSVAAAENRPQRARRATANDERMKSAGLNENYARELLELHTLGVDGGYSQKDVTELARLLTGWSLTRGNGSPSFVYRAALHDAKPKTVLGMKFDGREGMEGGERAIRSFATHPATAKHIATKLAQRFLSDQPPDVLVDRIAERFLETGGDLRETTLALLTSDEFLSLRYANAKVKTPFEFVVSAIRAVGAETFDVRATATALREMGQPLYFAPAPTGYDEDAAAWVSANGLVQRLNFAIALAAKTPVALPPDPHEASQRLLGRALSNATLQLMQTRASSETQERNLVAALVLGSAEFQRQ